MDNLVHHVAASIRGNRLARRGERLLVAVSGGLDSMVLLHLLQGLASTHQWSLTVAHFNHQLRGRSSQADEQLVRSQARRLGSACVVGRADVKTFARQHKVSTEMAARKLRHEFLARAARKRGIRAIAVAHHADDQVELFFLRLLRGVGGEGLAGMDWRCPSPADRRLSLIRPLLDQPKAVLEEFARARRIRFREDSSNARLDFPRNHMRHRVLPLLRQKHQPALTRVILRQMNLLAAESDWLNANAADWLKDHGDVLFRHWPKAIQRRALHLQLIQQGLAGNYEWIEALRSAAGVPVMVKPDVFIWRDDHGRLKSRTAPLPAFRRASPQAVVDLQVRRKRIEFGALTMDWRCVEGRLRPRRRTRHGCEWFDADRVGSRVILRHWRPGDRYQPIGATFVVKLQDAFTNLKIPRERRHRLLIATTLSGEVFWVEGLRISERFKVSSQTTRLLKWRWRRRPDEAHNSGGHAATDVARGRSRRSPG